MSPRVILAIVTVLFISVIGYAYLTLPSQTNSLPQSASVGQTQITSTASSTDTSGSTTTGTKMYTLADVKRHGTPSSCWATINGKVYDLTNWINQHPGGPERIEALCGTDGSAAFNAQHGTQARPNQELATFYIGDLAK